MCLVRLQHSELEHIGVGVFKASVVYNDFPVVISIMGLFKVQCHFNSGLHQVLGLSGGASGPRVKYIDMAAKGDDDVKVCFLISNIN